VETYHKAAIELGTVPGADFNLTWQRSETSHKNCDAARAALLGHEHDHACLGGRQAAAAHQAQ
jgi:hypothetical protein